MATNDENNLNEEESISQSLKDKKAVALGYRSVNADAPIILASGSGHVAQKLIEIAEQHGIHIESNQALAEALSKIDVGRMIPPELYKAVAEILAFVYGLDESA